MCPRLCLPRSPSIVGWAAQIQAAACPACAGRPGGHGTPVCLLSCCCGTCVCGPAPDGPISSALARALHAAAPSSTDASTSPLAGKTIVVVVSAAAGVGVSHVSPPPLRSPTRVHAPHAAQGAGGAGRALAFGAAVKGAKVIIANRSVQKAADLAAQVGAWPWRGGVVCGWAAGWRPPWPLAVCRLAAWQAPPTRASPPPHPSARPRSYLVPQLDPPASACSLEELASGAVRGDVLANTTSVGMHPQVRLGFRAQG